MAAPTNHTKLGLFVILGIAAVLVVAFGLGAQSMRKETVAYHTYFNESVQGLDVGSPVKFRGVTIGHVSAIEVAPDHRHVQVTEELDVNDIKRLGLTSRAPATASPRRRRASSSLPTCAPSSARKASRG